ncbi:MAG: DUF3048 C-terminal domain-containing protein, partial [Coriobacteriales bacterium]|nr:DUF3048 C-terminal domain-containing protein [Coriobacteriales bacterium]
LWIVPQYNALFFYSGATRPINSKVNSAGIANLSEDAGVSAPYFRSARRSSPHNLYLRPAAGRREAKRRGYPLNGKPKTLRFGRSIESSDVVREITVPLSDVQTSKWVYKGSTKRYSRFNGSTPHRDAVTGAPVTARNVVVLWATYRPVSRDKFGSTTYDITLGGEGRATLFRDGRKIDGTWEADRGQPPTIRAEDRRIVRLAPGNTWFEVVHTNVNIRMK